MAFFVVEGCDAVGKATQSKLLAAACDEGDSAGDPPTLLLSFPRYKTPIGEVILRHLRKSVVLAEERSRDSSDIRVDGDPYWAKASEDPLMFQCLMLADKVAAAPQILAQLRRGGDVITDRWWPSAFAYGGSDGLPDQWLLDIHAGLDEIVPVDRYFFLDLPPEIALERAVKRAEATGRKIDRYETLEKQKSVRERYLLLGGMTPTWRTIDASGTEAEVHQRIKDAP